MIVQRELFQAAGFFTIYSPYSSLCPLCGISLPTVSFPLCFTCPKSTWFLWLCAICYIAFVSSSWKKTLFFEFAWPTNPFIHSFSNYCHMLYANHDQFQATNIMSLNAECEDINTIPLQEYHGSYQILQIRAVYFPRKTVYRNKIA